MKSVLEYTADLRNDVVFEQHPLLKDESLMNDEEKKKLNIVRLRKANIEMLRECITHIKETWVLTDSDKEEKSKPIQQEIDDIYSAVYKVYGLMPEELDKISMKTTISQDVLDSYYKRLKDKGLQPEEVERKDISGQLKATGAMKSKIAKKLNLTPKQTENNDTPTKSGGLKEKLGLKCK